MALHGDQSAWQQAAPPRATHARVHSLSENKIRSQAASWRVEPAALAGQTGSAAPHPTPAPVPRVRRSTYPAPSLPVTRFCRSPCHVITNIRIPVVNGENCDDLSSLPCHVITHKFPLHHQVSVICHRPHSPLRLSVMNGAILLMSCHPRNPPSGYQ